MCRPVQVGSESSLLLLFHDMGLSRLCCMFTVTSLGNSAVLHGAIALLKQGGPDNVCTTAVDTSNLSLSSHTIQ